MSASEYFASLNALQWLLGIGFTLAVFSTTWILAARNK